MKSPVAADPEPYLEQSISSGGQAPSAKAIFEQRKSYAKEAAAMGEISEYKVEHLATFVMERKGGMLTVEDSIRKLKLLEARGKVWTQEICLYVDDKAIKIFDEASKDELEHYPINSIQHVQSVLDECIYKSICALVIKEQDQRTPDIHLFNCPNIPAEVIVADISSAFTDMKVGKKGQKIRSDTLSQHRDVIRASNSVSTATNPVSVQKKIKQWQTTIENINDPPSPSSPRSSNSNQHESSAEMVAFKIHREVQMLNHALDDVEVFVSGLQKAAEATRQLTVRSKRSSRRSSKKGKGGGVLELRSRLPPQEEFVDCFQKFKFCFNLLAKLKSHIKNPNAVELVHFLFQPLNMVVFTCGGPELARNVVCPLFSRDTIEFLQNCTTSDEAMFWRQLGNFWNMSRGEFPKENYFPPYIPKFKSGWEPPPLPSMGLEAPQELAAAVAEQADQVQRAEEAWKAGGSNIEESLKPLTPIPPPPVLQEVEKPQRKLSLQPPYDATSAFKQHVDSHIKRNIAAQNGTAQPQAPRELCRAMHDFTARNEHELSIGMDELLDVVDRSKSWWKVQNKQGNEGYVPQNLVLLISAAGAKSPSPPASAILPPPPPILASPPPVAHQQYNGLGTAYNNNNNNINKASRVPMGIPTPMFEIPPPPVLTPEPAPVPKTPPVIYAVPVKKQLNSIPVEKKVEKVITPKVPTQPKQSPAHLQEELRQRVESQQINRNFKIPRKSASSASLAISQKSSPNDIKHFLISNGFSQLTIDSLGVLTGAQIFSLTKDELKEICDDDGPRVHSKLLVQQSLENERAASQESELDAIMRKRRQNMSENGAE